MSDLKALLERAERAVSVVPLPPDGLDGLHRRRDRKRRNQRLSAGVVGIAVFVAAVWIVTAGGSLDRSETPAVSGSAETGPAVSNCVVTRCTENGPVQSTWTPTEQVKNALIAQGYHLQLQKHDDVIDDTGRGLCRGAQRLGPKLGDRLVPSLGEGSAKGHNEGFGTNLTSDDGAAIVEIFLTAYCPEVL